MQPICDPINKYINIYIYRVYLTSYLKHRQILVEEEAFATHNMLFQSEQALTPNVAFESFEEVCQKRRDGYQKGKNLNR